MDLTLADLNIILDTILATTPAGGLRFKYTSDQREIVAKKLIGEMSKTNLHIMVDD